MSVQWQEGKEYYEIRLESIGGLGANLCAKMLGELGIRYLNVNSSNFSSYGSEKTGTPVKGYVRFCNMEKEIRLHSPVMEPDLLVVFHQALLKDPFVWKGCSERTKVLIALDPGQEENEKRVAGDNRKSRNLSFRNTELFSHPGEIYGLKAQEIAMETGSRINVVMLGAALKVMGLDTPAAAEQICKDTLGKKYPASLRNNLEGIQRGFAEVRKWKEKTAHEKNERREDGEKKNSEKKEVQPKWGYAAAPIGGINPNPGSTVMADLSPSRQGYIPLFIKEKCINCGLCFSTCPDMVFQFTKGTFQGKEKMINQGLDYYHCKGCLRCVEVCPVQALVKGKEAQVERKEHFLPNLELLRKPKYYEASGADGYITSESFLTEKRIEGGEV